MNCGFIADCLVSYEICVVILFYQIYVPLPCKSSRGYQSVSFQSGMYYLPSNFDHHFVTGSLKNENLDI
jgi:hypothetical protein